MTLLPPKKYKEAVYFDYLKNKRVILIGPSDYLLGQKRGKEFDKYDVIIRMNFGCPVPGYLKPDLGNRTDVLYHVIMGAIQIQQRPDLFRWHTKEEIGRWKDDGLQWFVSKRDIKIKRVQKFAPIIDGIVPWTTIPIWQMRKIEMKLGINPNMATIVVNHLVRSKMCSLKVVGCDFHITGYYPGYGGMTAEQAAKGAGSVTCWGQIEQPTHNDRMNVKKIQIEYLSVIANKDKRLDLSELFEKAEGLDCVYRD